eukprot:6687307-Prymnesium_polylepis.1
MAAVAHLLLAHKPLVARGDHLCARLGRHVAARVAVEVQGLDGRVRVGAAQDAPAREWPQRRRDHGRVDQQVARRAAGHAAVDGRGHGGVARPGEGEATLRGDGAVRVEADEELAG